MTELTLHKEADLVPVGEPSSPDTNLIAAIERA